MPRPPEFPRFSPDVPQAAPPASVVPLYAELQCLSNFTFLEGASHAAELVAAAKSFGHAAIGVADRNSVAGLVRAHAAAKKHGLRLLPGVRLDTSEQSHGEPSCTMIPPPSAGRPPILSPFTPQNATSPGITSNSGTPLPFSLIAYPVDRAAWGRLTRLVTQGRRAAPKGECRFTFEEMLPALPGQMMIAVPPADLACPVFAARLSHLAAAHPGRVFLALSMPALGRDRARALALEALAVRAGVLLVAVNDVLMHAPERRPLADVLACIREKRVIHEAGFLVQQNAERHLKPPAEMARLMRDHPDAMANIALFLQACTFSLDELAYNYPEEPAPEGVSQAAHLRALALEGAARRYPGGVPQKVRAALEKELSLIGELNYEGYFLTVHDIVRFARSKGILCQGRGSAANSAVCYCLGVTAVDPATTSLLFERFISAARKEPPDIDVDFEHERREEVIQYIYDHYGRAHAALAATVITYRPRSAVREVGKAMGLTEDVTSALASAVWGSWGREIDAPQVAQAGLDIADPHLALTIRLTQELLGFPRHLSQHVGGFVLTRDRLDEVVPIGNAAMEDRTFIEWDKDDLDELKILKVDVLALGMLTCIAKSFDMIAAHHGPRFDLATLPKEDPAVYDMLCRADAIGVFQVESRAQMNMLPRMKPRRFYDLVIEVAIVRPGPIQGDMVHPYLRRRDGIETVAYPSPAPEHGPADELERVLGRTLGVPLFQEQAMQIAIDAAKFSPDEANELRRAMATFRRVGTIQTLQEKMVGRMIGRGYDPDFARRCFDQIKGFGEYGFPESHAASFALLVYASAWIKRHHPDVFCAALLNSQPMGFYAPAQIVRDAREHGVIVRPVDVGFSQWDCTLEELDDGLFAVRLGFRQLDGLREDVMRAFCAKREALPPLTAIEEVRAAGLTPAVLERLAAGDALRSLDAVNERDGAWPGSSPPPQSHTQARTHTGLDRRNGLWAVRGLASGRPLPLFDAADVSDAGPDKPVLLPAMPLSEHVVADYQTARLSLKAHPVSFLRPHYDALRVTPNAGLKALRHNARVTVAGVVLVRQRPGTAKGVVFMTIEDETGVANIVVWKALREKFRKEVMQARLIAIHGRVQRAGEGDHAVIHVVAETLADRTGDLALLAEDGVADFTAPLARADEVARPVDEDARVTRMRARAGRLSNNQPLPVPPPLPSVLPASASKPHPMHPRNLRVIPKSRDFH
jgi:error-prone DNA polymerase